MRPMTVTVADASGGAKVSALVRIDDWGPNFGTIACDVTGTVNYTVQFSMDDPNDPTNPVAEASMLWFSCPDTNLVAQTADKLGAWSASPKFIQCLLSSGNGNVKMTVLQSGGVV